MVLSKRDSHGFVIERFLWFGHSEMLMVLSKRDSHGFVRDSHGFVIERFSLVCHREILMVLLGIQYIRRIFPVILLTSPLAAWSLSRFYPRFLPSREFVLDPALLRLLSVV
jgi:hypothetical protein